MLWEILFTGLAGLFMVIGHWLSIIAWSIFIPKHSPFLLRDYLRCDKAAILYLLSYFRQFAFPARLAGNCSVPDAWFETFPPGERMTTRFRKWTHTGLWNSFNLTTFIKCSPKNSVNSKWLLKEKTFWQVMLPVRDYPNIGLPESLYRKFRLAALLDKPPNMCALQR